MRVNDIGLNSLKVECYAGYRDEETPRRLSWQGSTIEIAEVLDRWLAPDHRYFKVRGKDGGTYILRREVGPDRWELTMHAGGKRGGEEPPPDHS